MSTPSQTLQFARGESSLGVVLLAQRDRGVCAVLLGDDPAAVERELHARFPDATLVDGDPVAAQRLAALIALVESPRRGAALPLDPGGTPFQQRVWAALREIPAGATESYADLARRLGSPRAVRAVAQACAANPLAVIVPCHRVVRSDGALAGYRWGVERKRALLAREAAGRSDGVPARRGGQPRSKTSTSAASRPVSCTAPSSESPAASPAPSS